MSYFVVTEQPGPSWDASRPRRGHGPGSADGGRILLVIEAESEREVEARLAEDPWMSMEVLRIDTIEPWEILLDGRG